MDAITITTAIATTGPHTIALQPAPTAVVSDVWSAYQIKLMHKIKYNTCAKLHGPQMHFVV